MKNFDRAVPNQPGTPLPHAKQSVTRTSATAPVVDAADPDSAYFAHRDVLLGPARNRILTGAELCEAASIIYGSPEGLSLYGVSAPDMHETGIQLLGRTVVECAVDQYVLPVGLVLADWDNPILRESRHGDKMVVDLFCGSGNVGFHLGVSLGCPVFASENDSAVYQCASNNFDVIGSSIGIVLRDYRDLLSDLRPRSAQDVYVVEPPWGAAFTSNGLNLLRTSPPVPEILAEILHSRGGLTCLVLIKTNDQIAYESLAKSFGDAVHLRSITPTPSLPYGANMDFHLYRIGSPSASEGDDGQSLRSAS